MVSLVREALSDIKMFVESASEDKLNDMITAQGGEPRPVWRSVAGYSALHPLSHLTMIYARRGNHAEAVRGQERTAPMLRDLLADDTWLGTIDYNVGCAHALAGNAETAVGLVKKALELNPDLADWAKKDPDLDSIRAKL